MTSPFFFIIINNAIYRKGSKIKNQKRECLLNESSNGYNSTAVRNIMKRVGGRDGPIRHRGYFAHRLQNGPLRLNISIRITSFIRNFSTEEKYANKVPI